MRYRPIILIADDSQTFTMYLSILLGRMGFDVIPVSNGTDAVSMSKTFSPDLVLLDLHMPGMNGFDAAREIRAIEGLRNVPVILMAAHFDQSVRDRAAENDYGFLEKPVKVLDLHHTLQNFIVYAKGTRREHIRVSCSEKTVLSHGSVRKPCTIVTLSEGGVFIKSREPLPIDTPVSMTLSFRKQEKMTLKGKVIYSHGIYQGGLVRTTPGMAVAFGRIPKKYSLVLRAYILKLLLEDIIAEADEPVVTIE